jgi:hypothetical protein
MPGAARRRLAPDYLERIDTPEDWALLHARPGHHTVARTETVKFMVDLRHADKTCFLDTKKWEAHFEFVHRFIDPYADYERFIAREYRHEDRRFILGSVMHYLDGDGRTLGRGHAASRAHRVDGRACRGPGRLCPGAQLPPGVAPAG